MADITVEAAMLAGTSRGMRAVVFVNQFVGYMFGVNGDSDLDYMKTTNGGLTWAAAADVFTGSVNEFDVWYDQWTPGDTGRIIHIAFTENGSDDVSYFAFNTTNDTKTSIVDVFAGLSAVAGRGTFVSITKARGGNLFVGFDMDAFAETGLYRSTDNGATWGVRTNPLEATLDQYKLFPANAADPNDVWMIYQDASTDELTIKTHDDSANTNSESSALPMIEEATDAKGQYGFDGAIRHEDGHLIFSFINNYTDVGAAIDFKVYEWDGTTLTALTDIVTNFGSAVARIYYPSVYLNQDQPNHIYVAYTGKTDQSETPSSSAKIYYALSTDRGLSWTKDIAYSETATFAAQTWTPLNGERFLVVFRNASGLGLLTNHVNSKEFGFTPLNNYQSVKAIGQNNTGIISVSERIK